MNKDNHLIFEAFVNAKGGVHVNRPALQEEINTAKADLNKDKQLSDYELARAKAMDKAMHKDEQAEGAEHAFTVVSGGVDNTSDVGFDINPADHMKAQSLKHAVQRTIEDMQNDEDYDGTFPEEYREYVKDAFIMSNDNGDFVAVLPGHLSEDQIFDKLVDVRDNSENEEENAESEDERKERVQRGWDMNKKRWAKWKMENPEAAAKHAAKKAAGKEENAEHEPHGYPQGMTAIQNLVLNQLKKRGFQLTKIVHADKERDAYPTVFMMRSEGPMHNVVEIDGMGAINGEPYKEYLANLKDGSEDAEGAVKTPYNAMVHLTQAANEIRDILKSHADDEAQVEHIIRMAQIILEPKSDHTDAEYRKMLDGLIVILNRFIIVPMN